jgi:hypothetical protein
MTSLKSKLNEWIKREGQVAWVDIKSACETGKFGRIYKLSNAERRLRASDSPNIETVMSENGKYIMAYKAKPPLPSPALKPEALIRARELKLI